MLTPHRQVEEPAHVVTVARPVHEVLAAPELHKPAAPVTAEEKEIGRPPETERTTIIDMPEKDPIIPMLTLPEPVSPAHLSPYVAETLAATPNESVPTESEPAVPLSPILAPHYEQPLPTVEIVEGTRPEPEVISTEAMSAEIEKIINVEPKPEATVDSTYWAEFAAAHEPDIEREPTPLESFTYFAQSLEDWHDTPADVQVGKALSEQDSLIELPAEIPLADKKAMVAISHEVADKLTHLEPVEVEEVAPVIAEISTTITKLHELSHSTTEEDLVALEETREELEELCKQLFEALDIEYDETSINYFIQVMLLKQFKTSIDLAAYKDRLGTHESKHHFPALGAMAQLIAGEVFHFVLGRLALLQTNPQEERQLVQSSLSV